MHCTKIAAQVGVLLQQKSMKIVTAESCTGGLLSAVITEIPGSSHWFDRAFITYSNEAKQEMLNVDKAIIEQQGAVSESVVTQMAKGAIDNSLGQIAVAISGIAGPGGATLQKPIGLVWFGFAINDQAMQTEQKYFKGDRQAVREQAVEFALRHVLTLLEKF